MRNDIYTILFVLCATFQLSAQKMNGICLVGPFEENPTNKPLENIKKINANWLAIIPEAIVDRATLSIASTKQAFNWTLSNEGYIRIIRMAKSQQFKVFLKPHLIVNPKQSTNDKMLVSTSWRGEIAPKNENEWDRIENNYADYILEMAQIAASENVDLFCIGTELNSMVKQRPKYWEELIIKVRKIYTGPITYSANWDNYENIPFWSSLDFIGLNGYFPINNKAVPKIKKTKRNWNRIKKNIKKFSESFNKKIIITEYGYRNVTFSGREPWEHDNGDAIANDSVQYNLLSSFYESWWHEDWMLGGFLWNWNYKSLPSGNTDFSIQNKSAYQLTKKWYTNYQ